MQGCSNIESITIPFIGNTSTNNSYTLGYLFGSSSFEGANSVTQYYSSSYYDYRTYYIPTSLKTVEITGGNLNYGAFYNCSSIENIILGDDTTKIGNRAFYGCTSLNNINLKNVEQLGSGTFYNCSSLKKLTLPSNLKTILSDAFYGCDNLQDIYYDGSLDGWSKISFQSETANPMNAATNFYQFKEDDYILVKSIELFTTNSISQYAFSDFKDINSIILPETLIEIQDYAFRNCLNVTEVNIPNSVQLIGNGALSGCSKLQSLTIPFVGKEKNEISTNSSVFGYIFGNKNYTNSTSVKQYYEPSNYVNYYIPIELNTVTINGGEIKYGAFYNCINISTINLSEEITTINNSAFYNCTALSDFSLSNIKTIGKTAFSGTSLIEIYIPTTLERVDENAWPSSLEKVYYDGTLEDWCSKISFTNTTSTPMHYGKHFFLKDMNDYVEITSLNLNGIDNINAYAFNGFNELVSITTGSNLKVIDKYVFANCEKLKNLNINGVEKLAEKSFYNCDGLTFVDIPSTVKILEKNVFTSSANLSYVFIPNSVEVILAGDKTYSPFYNCNSSLTIYTSCEVVKDGWETYWNASKSYICEIINEEFNYIANFKEENYSLIDGVYYYISEDKTKIYALGVSDSSLDNIVLAASTTRVCYKAFYNCSKLSNITLRKTIKNIANYAFEGCTSLNDVYFDGTINDWLNIKIGRNTGTTNFSSTPMYYAEKFFLKVDGDWEELTELKIDETNQKIEQLQFYGFDNLIKVEISDSVVEIGPSAFYNCTSLTSVNIGNGVALIESRAFAYCSSLRSIYIPNNVQQIIIKDNSSNYAPFYKCSSALKIYCEDVEAQDGWETYWDCYNSSYTLSKYFDYKYEEYLYAISTDKSSFNLIDNVYYYISEGESEVYALGVSDKTVSEIVLDERTTRISPIAFKNCTNLTSIVITEKVEYIALDAFTGCTNLTTVYVDSTNIYNSLKSKYSCGSVFENSTIIYVLKDIVNTETSNEYLNNADVFSKVEEGEYFKYSRI